MSITFARYECYVYAAIVLHPYTTNITFVVYNCYVYVVDALRLCSIQIYHSFFATIQFPRHFHTRAADVQPLNLIIFLKNALLLGLKSIIFVDQIKDICIWYPIYSSFKSTIDQLEAEKRGGRDNDKKKAKQWI